MAVEVKNVGAGYRLGTGLRITSGTAAGRQMYCIAFAEDIFFCDGVAEANLQRFRGVAVGDSVHIDNRAFLAFCYYSRHHLMSDKQFDSLRLDGKAIYPEHDVPLQSSLMGVSYSGDYSGKLLWVHHTHDSSLWPPQGIIYRQAVEQAQGAAGLERFCLRWTENAEHIPPAFAPSDPERATSTWLVNYQPIIEQSLVDLARWVEDDVVPAATVYSYEDGRIILPATAADRGGIQPVISVSVAGQARAEIAVGEPVTLTARAEVPPGAGKIIALEWDFDGTGGFACADGTVDGTLSAVAVTATATYANPGTYFATARVTAHREGDMAASTRRVENLASVRIVVR
jgi:hypothetical protein